MEDAELKANGTDGWFFAGVVVGMAIGLLFAPQAGDETRAMLREKAIQVQARASDLAEKLR